MKKIFVFLFLILALYGADSYGEDITVSNAVYCDGHTLTLDEAVGEADEGDHIYITNDMTIDSPVFIDKSLKIQSLGQEIYKITMGSGTDKAFILSHPSSLVLENIHIKSTVFDKKALIGDAEEIIILNSEFEKSNVILNGGSGIGTKIKNSRFMDSRLEVTPNSGKNSLLLYNNNFMTANLQFESVVFRNMDMDISQNIFSDYTFKIEEGTVMGSVYNNTFEGKRNITINASGDNIRFYHNRIYKQYYYGINYSGTAPVDFRNNWWGSIKGPENIYLNGNINYGNWALYQDFSRFKDDPYTLKDLKGACDRLGEGIENNWLYNLKQDDRINALDLIGITRRIVK